MEFKTLEEEVSEAPDLAAEVQPTSSIDYAKLIADVAAQVLKIDRSSLDPYVEICRIIGFNEAANEVGVGKVMSPYTRLAVGGIILGAGIFLAWRRHGYRSYRDVRRREELPISSDAGGRSELSEGVNWTDRRSQFEALLTEAMAMDRAGSSYNASTVGGQGSSSGGSPPIDTTGGDMEFGTPNTSSSGPEGRSSGN